MKIVGICHLCGKPAMRSCSTCGLITCKTCIDGHSGVCIRCAPLVTEESFEDEY